MKQAGVAFLTSNKIDIKPKAIKRYGEGYFIFIKGQIRQDDVSILNICAPNTKAPTFVKEILLNFTSHMEPTH